MSKAETLKKGVVGDAIFPVGVFTTYPSDVFSNCEGKFRPKLLKLKNRKDLIRPDRS